MDAAHLKRHVDPGQNSVDMPGDGFPHRLMGSHVQFHGLETQTRNWLTMRCRAAKVGPVQAALLA